MTNVITRVKTLLNIPSPRERAYLEAIEEDKERRLARAETEVRDLVERGNRAVQFLSERDKRNHWSESVGKMIRGDL